MSVVEPSPDRILMSQKERDILKIMHAVLSGKRSRAASARLRGKSTRQIRRLQRKREAGFEPRDKGQALPDAETQ